MRIKTQQKIKDQIKAWLNHPNSNVRYCADVLAEIIEDDGETRIRPPARMESAPYQEEK